MLRINTKTHVMKSEDVPILFAYKSDELLELIRQLLRSELERIQRKDTHVSYETPGLIQKPLYKATEVCKLLHISRQTLHMWSKDGILKPYKIKSRLYYLWSDLEDLIKNKSK
jgi:Helix-turn-helix domain